jgi:ABC-type tungstate transport system permease subunit
LTKTWGTALADAFIEDRVSNGSEPFRVAWYQSDTTYSINYLKDALIDVAITYSPAAEKIAIQQGIALAPDYYAFRDHFLIVGPPSNPANISGASDIYTLFSDLHEAAEAKNTTPPVRFLSRYDKSATNIKESDLWISIGQVHRHSPPPFHFHPPLTSHYRSPGQPPTQPGTTNTSPSPSKRYPPPSFSTSTRSPTAAHSSRCPPT